MQDRIRYQILKQIEANPEITQRELANCLGISLGKVHYCLQALIAKGIIKAKNFVNSNNKQAYFYQLTPKGLEDKLRVTKRFFKDRLQDYELIKKEIEELKRELDPIE